MAGSTKMAEAFVGLFSCTSVQFPGQPQAIQCHIDQGMSFTGPASTLLGVIQKQPVQVKWTDAWTNRIWQMMHERAATANAQTQQTIEQDREAQNRLHAMLMANQQAQYDAGVKRNQVTNDAMHASMQASVNHMGDVDVYHDPSTGNSFRVSNQYSHTYVDNLGKMLVQTNSEYVPGPSTVWQELQPQ